MKIILILTLGLQLCAHSVGIHPNSFRDILETYYNNNTCCDCITPIEGSGNKSSSYVYSQEDMAKAMGLKIQADPNPATNWVAFDYELPIGNDHAQLLIRNTEGKQIAQFQIADKIGQKVWDTRSIKSGTYLYVFISGKLKESGKIVIIK